MGVTASIAGRDVPRSQRAHAGVHGRISRAYPLRRLERTDSLIWAAERSDATYRASSTAACMSETAAGPTPLEGPDDEYATSSATWSAAVIDGSLDALGEVDLDRLDRAQIQTLLREITGPLRRLEAARSRITGALHRRESAGVVRPGAANRACQNFLTNDLGLSPSEAKDVTSTSHRLPDAPATSDAYQHGKLTSRHASVIASCLQHIPAEHAEAVEQELLHLAERADPVALGRRARQLIAEHDAKRLRTIERRRHARRRFSYHDTEYGSLRFSGELFGVQAEQARTAFDAFTQPPQPDDRRSHDQRRADSFVTLTGAALRVGEAPTQHGVRPHVLVVISHDQLAQDLAGQPATVRLGSGEPVTFDDARYTVDDCHVTRIALDAAGVPIEASSASRTVPSGLWRALQVRDQGCTWEGCTAPTAWCDVAHLHQPHANGGGLTLDNTALLCRRHHRRYDAGGWRADIDGRSVTYHEDASQPSVSGLIHRHRRRSQHAQQVGRLPDAQSGTRPRFTAESDAPARPVAHRGGNASDEPDPTPTPTRIRGPNVRQRNQADHGPVLRGQPGDTATLF